MEPINKIESKIKNNNKEFIDKELRPFLRIPSNTMNKEGIQKAKDFIISYINSFSETITEYKGTHNPLILAKVGGKKKETILIYMMYDTQPISERENWICDPFSAEIHTLDYPLEVLGDCIIARGAYNSKTPLICFLNVVRILKRNNELPISLLFFFDGEEEIGSPTLLKFIEERKELFKDCIDAFYPATKQNITGNSILKLGYKGILSLTIKVRSKNNEPHSAYSGMIPNPAADLISVLNLIYSNGEFQINSLRKSYNLTVEEESILNELINHLDIESIKKKAGILQTLESDTKLDFINYLFNPTFNISTLKSGFLGEGFKNYVPNNATTNIDIRFAHNVPVDVIFHEIKEKIEKFSINSNSEIELTKNLGYESSRVKKNTPLVKSLIKSAKVLGVKTELWPISAAGAPLSKIQKFLNLNFITGGLGVGGSAHSANEFIQYSSIVKARLSYYNFLKIYSQLIQEQNMN